MGARLRAAIDKDLRRHGFPHAKAVALVISLLDETLIRVGNVAYKNEHESYGLTIMLDEHLAVNGAEIQFRFVGKSGQE